MRDWISAVLGIPVLSLLHDFAESIKKCAQIIAIHYTQKTMH
jgi:hypothetical protein